MPIADTLDKVASELRDIGQFNTGEVEKAAHDLARIRQVLSDCKAQNPVLADLSRLDQLEGEYSALATPVADRLALECAASLSTYEADGQVSNADERAIQIQQLRQRLDSITQLLPSRRQDVADLQKRVQALSNKLSSVQRLQALSREVAQLWERASRLESHQPEVAIDECARAALAKTVAALAEDTWGQEERDLLVGLRGEAENRLRDLLNRLRKPTTLATGEEMVRALVDLIELEKRSPKAMVYFFENEELSAIPQYMEVSNAVPIAKARMVSLFWGEKIEAYIAQADRLLNEDHPRDAMAALRQWESLPGLHDERIGLALPRNLTIRIDTAAKRIQPDLDRFNDTDRKVREASVEPEVVKAFSLWKAAIETYPSHPALETLRQVLMARMREEARERLAEAEDYLRKEQWERAASRLSRVTSLFDLIPDIRRPLDDQYHELLRISHRLAPLTRREDGRLKLDEERALLTQLRNEEQEYWSQWPKLTRRLAELQARGKMQNIQREVDALCQTETLPEDFAELLADCTALSESPPPGMSAEDTATLAQAIRRLKAWLGFAEASRELAKTAARRRNGQEVSFRSAPDLSVVQRGLQAARRDREAWEAVRDARLEERLQELRANDKRALIALEDVEALSLDLPVPKLKSALQTVTYWLDQATSYRTRFLVVRGDLHTALGRAIEERVRFLLGAAASSNYETLDYGVLETDLADYSVFDRDGGASLAALAKGPIAMAKAHWVEAEAKGKRATWKDACSQWEDAAWQCGDDKLRVGYCTRRSRQAHKLEEISRARAMSNPEEAEPLMRSLCDDPVLGDDSQVWLEHSQICFSAAREGLRGRPLYNMTLWQYLERARESLQKADHFSAVDDGIASGRLEALRKDLQTWELLAGTRAVIERELPRTGAITSAACRNARRAYEEASQTLRTGEAANLLEKFWGECRQSARGPLIAQATRPAADLFDQIDAWLGLAILFPDEDVLRIRLQNLTMGVLRQIRAEIQDSIWDYSAAAFQTRYARRHHEPLGDREIIEAQLVEARELMGKVEVVNHVLSVLAEHAPVGGPGLTDLAIGEHANDPAEWETQLKAFKDVVDLAASLARDGLRAPAQFSRARYILYMSVGPDVDAPATSQRRTYGQSSYPELPRVDEAFRSHGHPTLSWVRKCVEDNERRRSSQSSLRRQIEILLRYEHVRRVDDLPLESGDPEEQALLTQMRENIQKPLRVYPLTMARDLMKTMWEAEERDACGQQELLRYRNRDENDHEFRALARIYPVVQQKVKQLELLAGWLSQFQPGLSVVPGGCPGVIDWLPEKRRILRMADANPGGLSDALAVCKRALSGDDKHLVHEGQRVLWPLERAYDALSYEAMLAYLKRVDALRPGDSPEAMLYTAASGIDATRQQMRDQIGAQIEECRHLQENISERIREFPQRWEEFRLAYEKLMKKGKRAGYGSSEWLEFETAAERFCMICPEAAQFRSKLQYVREQCGLMFECPEMVGDDR